MNVYMGQILQFAGTFVPQGFLPCDGRLLSISDYSTLYTLLGTTYGGDGSTTFGLPNLVGAVPVGAGNAASGTNYTLGQTGGAATVTLNANQGASHSHALGVITGGGGSGTGTPGPSAFVADQTTTNPQSAYAATTPTTVMANGTSPIGGSQPHSNLQPVLPVTYCISTDGIYPQAN